MKTVPLRVDTDAHEIKKLGFIQKTSEFIGENPWFQILVNLICSPAYQRDFC